MEDVNLITEALKFMALGMGIVFTFLVIMIFALKLQASLISRILKEDSKLSKTQHRKSSNTDDSNITAAITAAIIFHNNKG